MTVAAHQRAGSRRRSSGSQSGSAGSTISVSYGASGTMPASVWATSGTPVAFQSWARWPADRRLATDASHAGTRPRTPECDARDRTRRDRTGARQIVGRGVEPEAPQAKDRRRLLDCPDGAAVIAQRVVVAVIGRECSDAPSAEHVGREQPADDRRHVVGIDDSGRQAVADVRAGGTHEGLAGIHRERDERFIVHPPVAIETGLQVRGRGEPRLRASPRAPVSQQRTPINCCAAYQ